MDDLQLARSRAALARLSEDKPEESGDLKRFETRRDHKDSMLRHGVLMSEAVTPILEKRLVDVCERLKTPRSSVTAFIFNSADVQADCLIDTPNSCVLRISSGLVNLMDEHEFKFVIGHELGHFLLNHGVGAHFVEEDSPENYITQRERELSVDRIGYLAVGSLNESIQAIIKTASGLSEKLLRFDVTSFLSQADMISDPAKGEAYNSTHPSMLIRCRSLLWFSMSIDSFDQLTEENRPALAKINQRVINDLTKFVDGRVRLRRKQLELDVALWKTALLLYHSGSFSKDIQERVEKHLGFETLSGMKSFFDLYSKSELLSEITKRLDKSLATIRHEFPKSLADIEDSGFETAYLIMKNER